MDNKYFNLLRQQIKHTGSIVASIDGIVRYDLSNKNIEIDKND